MLVLTPVLCIKPEPGIYPHALAMPWGLPGDPLPPYDFISSYHMVAVLQRRDQAIYI